jgi:hypothetical protein
MRITPITSTEIIGRYAKQGMKVVDTWLNQVLYTGSTELATSKALARVNRIGLLNNQIINRNAVLPQAQQRHLLDFVA